MGIENLLEPKSVILIGDSKSNEEISMAKPFLYRNIKYNLSRFYRGKKSFINLSKGYKSIPESDLAIIALEPEKGIKMIKKCAESNVKSIVDIVGGYSNKEMNQIKKIIKKHKIRFLGPGTILGIINTNIGLNTTFHRELMPEKGSIAVVSQSGGCAAEMLSNLKKQNVGLSYLCCVGSKIDVDDIDLLRYFSKDEGTKVICLYMEGLEKGRGSEFIEISKKISKTKPILVVKSGKTQESAKRALSHTSSISGSDEIWSGAFKSARIIEVKNTNNMFEIAKALNYQPLPKGDIAIISNVGGPSIELTDSINEYGLKLAEFKKETIENIKEKYPKLDVFNPLDTVADAKKERIEFILDNILKDENVGSVILSLLITSCYLKPEDLNSIDKLQKYNKPILLYAGTGNDFEKISKKLKKSKIPVYDSQEKVVKAMKTLYDYKKQIRKT